MKCTTCGYALWNLQSRTCPECGTGFRPSEFTFRQNAVRYLCPHCKQDYYGTSPEGHLVPNRFACVSCRRDVSMDDMILLPTEGVAERDTRQHHMPWTETPRLPFFSRYFKTTGMALIQPGTLMAARTDASPLRSAWWYYTLTMGAVMVAGTIAQALFFGLFFALASAGGGGMPVPWAMVTAMYGGVFALIVVITVLFTILWALSAHAVLRLTGPVTGTVRSTFHAILYSSGTFILAIIPCVNNVSSIWWVVSAILMVRRAQDVSGWRASFAVLTLPVVSFFAFIALYAWVIYAAVSAGGGGGAVVTTPGAGFTRSTTTLSETAAAIVDRAAAEGGWDATDHAALLILDGHLDPWQFVGDDTTTIPEDIPFLDTTLAELEDADAATLARSRSALPPLPPNVVAHRVGDFVFTYHGIDASDPPPGVWIVIEDDMSGTLRDAYAVDAYGTVQRIPRAMRAQIMSIQNAARAAHGLPPVPIPSTVTSERPGVTDGADAPP